MSNKEIQDIKEIAQKLLKEDQGNEKASLGNITEILADLSDLVVNHPEVLTIIADNGLRRHDIKNDTDLQ